MTKKQIENLNGKFITLKCLKLSDVPVSEDGKEDISNAGNITYGDSSHCLYRISDIRREVDFINQSDRDLLEILQNEMGDIFIDLEN